VVTWKYREKIKLLLHVNPSTIQYFLKVDRNKAFPGAPKNMTARTFKKKRYVGIVVSDKAVTHGRPLEKCRHVQAMYQHFCEGKNWEQTEYLKLYKKKYKQKQIQRNQGNSFNDFCNQKLVKYDQIFKDIQENGYKASDSIEQNIEIALGPGGEPLLIDGRHRLIIAQILGLAHIPVVANLISEQLINAVIQNADFFKQQLSKGRIKKRVKLLTQIEGGFRNKGVLIIPGNNRMTQNQTREKPVNE